MITVVIYGLDQFVVGDLSKDITPLLAKLYEVNEDEINFVAPNTMVFHNGVEQTSWNTIVHVYLPMKVSVLQDKSTKIITTLLKEVTIHIEVEFYYYSQDHRVVEINEDYPRYITEENSVETECDCDHDHEHLDEGEEEDEIYTGDIFQDFANKNKK